MRPLKPTSVQLCGASKKWRDGSVKLLLTRTSPNSHEQPVAPFHCSVCSGFPTVFAGRADGITAFWRKFVGAILSPPGSQ